MPKSLPQQPNLEHFRKQAKQLLRDLRAGDSAALERVHRRHRPPMTAEGAPRFSLHDAQLVVAREFGMASWRRLVDAVEASRDPQGPTRHALITGGAGFIGSHLAETLLAKGHRVTAVDNLSRGDRANVAHLADHSSFELVVADVCDADQVDPLVAEADVVYHLAANYGQMAAEEPTQLLRTNVHGTEVVLESASRHGARLLFASTSAVYGDLEPGTVLHEDGTVLLGNPRVDAWDYAITKIVSEQMVRAHTGKHGLPSTTVRLFNVLGPRQPEHTVLPKFLGQALRGDDITVFGDGEQRRCFVDVRDAVGALARLADCEAACGETVNIGSRFELTVNRVAEMVKTSTRSDSSIAKVAYEHEMVLSKVPSLSKARQLIGYSPAHRAEDTIREVVALADGGSANES
jgi:UDP-glucose 4-epimerase